MTKSEKNSGETKLIFRLPKQLHYDLKILSVNLDKPMAELCREAIQDLILKKSHKLSVIQDKKKNNS